MKTNNKWSHVLCNMVSIMIVMMSSGALFPGLSQETGKTYIKGGEPTGSGGASPRESVQYYDGFGRPVQAIRKGASPFSTAGASVDLADYQEYDANGRPSRTWLTVPVAVGANHAAGATVSLSSVASSGSTAYGGDAVRYSEVIYDGSPLDFTSTEYGPGAAWRTAGKGVNTQRLTNDASGGRLTCKKTSITWTGNTSYEVGAPSVVPAGTLTVSSVVDEDGREALTFTDIFGNKILERRIDLSASSQDYRYLDTWYLYDRFGRLEAVFPPELSSSLSALSNPTPSQLSALPIDKFAFIYRYDSRDRCIASKLPGCGWTYHIYDKGDRAVLTQDAEQRKSDLWTFCLQDALGRICVTGTCTGSWNAFGDALGDTQVLAEYAGTGGSLMGYNLSGITLASTDIASVTYYDSYGFITDTVPFAKRGLLAYQTPVTGCDGQYATSAAGMRTGAAVKVFGKEGESMYLYSAQYYDAKGRIVQERRTDHLGGGLSSQAGYAFTGEPLHRRVAHILANGTVMTEDYTYTYDDWGRLLQTGHKLGTGSTVILSSNTYDSVGRLYCTGRGSNPSLATTYSYNVRSWLTGQTGPYSEELAYNTADNAGNNTPQWGGNVSSLQWMVTGENTAHRYAFGYDGVSRLVSAVYSGYSGADYGSTYSYDRNGNLKTQTRKGPDFLGNFITLENKTYMYNGNQLMGDGGAYSVQSSYDDKGRQSADCFHHINSITYNLLDLPETMDFTEQASAPRSVRNWYAADGAKLRHEWQTNSGTTTTDYSGNLIYNNGVLNTILIDGGYIEVNNAASSSPQYNYRWYLTDHQGSNRAVMDASGNILQSSYYYPYGIDFKIPSPVYVGSQAGSDGQTGLKYKYSGKEQISSGNLGWYDFGARWYDPSHARWTTPDPMAEKYYSISPYVYCASNPVNIVDPEGMDIWEVNRYGLVVYYIEDKERDAIYIMDKKGSGYQRATNNEGQNIYMQFSPGTITGNNSLTSPFVVNNSYWGKELFKFLSDNTSVEIGIVTTSSGKSFIASDNQENKVKIDLLAYILDKEGETISSVLHSHPKNTIPSGFNDTDTEGDKFSLINLKEQLNYEVFHATYNPGEGSVLRYTASGINKKKNKWRTFNSYQLFNLPQVKPIRSKAQ